MSKIYPKMCLNVEFLAGTGIEEAVSTAKQFATNMGVSFVCFDFNGVSISVTGNTDVFDIVEAYNERTSCVSKHKNYIVGR